ncbi:uncharacterized protein LOC142823891 isoform X2 [Pelodiscus sinensis]|uniref:uncharacterized protein LOC142823891 isoform X2 n=1 Tax=Pelodiscus sinensis TaxID=13735 RepID=UPI003F6BF20B
MMENYALVAALGPAGPRPRASARKAKREKAPRAWDHQYSRANFPLLPAPGKAAPSQETARRNRRSSPGWSEGKSRMAPGRQAGLAPQAWALGPGGQRRSRQGWTRARCRRGETQPESHRARLGQEPAPVGGSARGGLRGRDTMNPRGSRWGALSPRARGPPSARGAGRGRGLCPPAQRGSVWPSTSGSPPGQAPSPAASAAKPSAARAACGGTGQCTAGRSPLPAASAAAASRARSTSCGTRRPMCTKSPAPVPSAARLSCTRARCCCTTGPTPAPGPSAAPTAARASPTAGPCGGTSGLTREGCCRPAPAPGAPSASSSRSTRCWSPARTPTCPWAPSPSTNEPGQRPGPSAV